MQLNFTINIDDRFVNRIKGFFRRRGVIASVSLLTLLTATFLFADVLLEKPYTFNTGDTIYAEQINKNFDELYDRINSINLAVTGVPVGSITIRAGSADNTKVPEGWMICDGRELDIEEYKALYDVIGTTYGGLNGFRLPDLRGRVVVGVNSNNVINSTDELDKMGGKYGDDAVSLKIENMPKHKHTFEDSGWGKTENGEQYELLSTDVAIINEGLGEIEGFKKTIVGIKMGVVNKINNPTSEEGGVTPSNIIQPSIALYYIIKYKQ
jgi:microcystin-dependent protein